MRGAHWLVSTDADSVVPPHWLSAQLSHEHAAVCGIIELLRASFLSTSIMARYRERYHGRDGHTRVHGAKLGVSTAAYLRCGGFPYLPACEDVALVAALQKVSIANAWRANPCALTSARLNGRAPDVLGAYREPCGTPQRWSPAFPSRNERYSPDDGNFTRPGLLEV